MQRDQKKIINSNCVICCDARLFVFSDSFSRSFSGCIKLLAHEVNYVLLNLVLICDAKITLGVA